MPVPKGFIEDVPRDVPKGFTLDERGGGVPEGFTLDEQGGNVPKGFTLDEQGSIPEEKKPIFEAKTTAEDVTLQAISNLANTAGFGLPGFVAGKAGFEIPKPATAAGGIGAGIGELGGFIAGPGKVGGKVSQKLFAKTVLKNPNMLKTMGLMMGKHAVSLGVASGLMTPEEGLFAPAQRLRQMGSGAVMGSVFGGLSFIPSTPGRMVANAAAFGVPSTLADEPIEQQIFNYGLGAFFGRKGLSAKTELEKQKKLSKLIENGFETKEAKLASNAANEMLDIIERDTNKSGREPFRAEDRINDIIGKNKNSIFTYNDKGRIDVGLKGKEYREVVRVPLVEQVIGQIRKLKKRPSTALRTDDVDYIMANYGSKKKLDKLTDQQLDAFSAILENPGAGPTKGTVQPQPYRAPNIYDAVFRPFYSVMEKMGFGNRYGSGLTSTRLDKDFDVSIRSGRHQKLTALWKNTLGYSDRTAFNVAAYLDGKLPATELTRLHGEKALTTAKQMRRYFDIQLDAINRQLARNNEPLIERRENYLTHIFDKFQADITSKDSSKLPTELLQQIEHILPKRKFFRFGIKRKGNQKGFSEDLWKIIDTYSARANISANDDFIRRATRYNNFLTREIKLNKSGDQNYDYAGAVDLQKNVQKMIKDAANRPGLLDENVRTSMKDWNKWMTNLGFENLQIDNISRISDFATSMIYGTQMGFRPKLALRNLGQHMLVVGQTGFKPLAKALTVKRTPQVLDILSKMKIVEGRASAFAPDSDAVKGFVKSGMWMFQKADMKNVVDSALAGYFQKTGGRFAKPGSALERAAITRGSEVAGTTQFLYLNGNRNGLSRGLGLSRTLRPLSIFTTWPTNYIEFLVASAKPEHRANLIKYLGTSMGFIGISALMGIKGLNYTGLDSPSSLFKTITTGKLPISGVLEGSTQLSKPNVGLFKDIKKTLDDQDLRQLLFYTLKEE